MLAFPVVPAPRRIMSPPRVEKTLFTAAVLLVTHGPRAIPVMAGAAVPDPFAAPPGRPESNRLAAPPPITMSPPDASEQVPAAAFQPVHMVFVESMSMFPAPEASASAQKTTSPPPVRRSMPVTVSM